MSRPQNSGEWAVAINRELKHGRITNAQALVAFRLATVVNWSPTEPERRGRPAVYWKNELAMAHLGIEWRTFERHRSALRKVGLISTDAQGNLVPRTPVRTDADKIDAVNTDGPYKEDLFKDSLFKESFEVEEATVKTDGASAGYSVRQPWPDTASFESSHANEPDVTDEPNQSPGWGWVGLHTSASA